MRRSIAILAGIAAAWPAAAAGDSRADLDLRFANGERDVPTPMVLGVAYRGPDPDGKPSPIRAGVIEVPPGTRFGGGDAIPACTAPDEELRVLGRDACPDRSRVGGGTLTAITGFGAPFDPVHTEVTVFKTPDGFVELVQQPGTNVTLGLDRARVEGSRITLNPPTAPGGPPDGETAVRSARFLFDIPEFVLTPSTCPPDGQWRSSGRFTFADGHTATATDATPCRRAAAAPPRPSPPPRGRPRERMSLKVTPRRARAGRAVRYRFRVATTSRRCRARVAISFAGRRIRTDRRGRASLRMSSCPAVRTARASKRGCGRAAARVVVAR